MTPTRIKLLTAMPAEEVARLSSLQCRMLRALADAAPNGRVRFTADKATGGLIIEPIEEPQAESEAE